MKMTPRVRTFIIATLIWLALVSLTLLAQVTPQVAPQITPQVTRQAPAPACFDVQFPAPAPGPARDAWANALRQDADWLTPAPMQDAADVRMIAEVVVPGNQIERMRQRQRLRKFHEAGYNWILFSYSEDADPGDAVELLSELAPAWSICLAFDVTETPYLKYEKISTVIEQGARHCDAIYPLWREAIGPHWSDDNARGLYVDTIARMAREANPNITILGEMYFSPRDGWHVTRPAAAGAMVIQNVGMQRVRVEWCVEIADTLTDLPLLSVVIGPPAAYTHRDVAAKQAWFLKARIEDRFRSVEVGTITLSGDGTGTTDRLTER